MNNITFLIALIFISVVILLAQREDI